MNFVINVRFVIRITDFSIDGVNNRLKLLARLWAKEQGYVGHSTNWYSCEKNLDLSAQATGPISLQDVSAGKEQYDTQIAL